MAVFRDYRSAHEDFNGPNYVASGAEALALQAAISVPDGAPAGRRTIRAFSSSEAA